MNNETLQVDLLSDYDDDVIVQCINKGVVYDIVDVAYPEDDSHRVFLKLRKARVQPVKVTEKGKV